jgi:hypothetical protein
MGSVIIIPEILPKIKAYAEKQTYFAKNVYRG